MAINFGQLPTSSKPTRVFAPDSSMLKGTNFSSEMPMSPRRLRRLPILPIIGLVILIVGGIAALIAVQTNFDLRQWAWGGVTTNNSALQGQPMSLESATALATQNKEAAQLFVNLTKTYYDADVVNIDMPEFKVKGVVFKKYDPSIDRTIVFGRLENLPLIQAVPQMWLSAGDVFVPSGVGQLTLEADVPVGYFMTSLEGDDSVYETLHFSYDKDVDVKRPTAIFLSVDFDEPLTTTQEQQ